MKHNARHETKPGEKHAACMPPIYVSMHGWTRSQTSLHARMIGMVSCYLDLFQVYAKDFTMYFKSFHSLMCIYSIIYIYMYILDSLVR